MTSRHNVLWVLIIGESCLEAYHDLRVFIPPDPPSQASAAGNQREHQAPIPLLRVPTAQGPVYAALVPPSVPLSKHQIRAANSRQQGPAYRLATQRTDEFQLKAITSTSGLILARVAAAAWRKSAWWSAGGNTVGKDLNVCGDANMLLCFAPQIAALQAIAPWLREQVEGDEDLPLGT